MTNVTSWRVVEIIRPGLVVFYGILYAIWGFSVMVTDDLHLSDFLNLENVTVCDVTVFACLGIGCGPLVCWFGL